MRNFGFLTDITECKNIQLEEITSAFENFVADLTPKHVKSCICHIITTKPTAHIKNDKIITGPLELHTFDESSWLTDWYYFLPDIGVEKWLKYAAMVGPGPIILRSEDMALPDFNSRLVIMLNDEGLDLQSHLQNCLYTLYHDEGARKLFSKLAKGTFLDERKKLQNVSSIHVQA